MTIFLPFFECLTPETEDAEPLSVTEVIKKLHAEKRGVAFARNALTAINLPSSALVQHLRRKYKIPGSSTEEIEKLETYMDPVRVTYMDFFNRTAEWNTKYRHKDIDFCLDVMESFDRYVHTAFVYRVVVYLSMNGGRVMPCPTKVGELLFYSTSQMCFSAYVDVDTVIMSMIFNTALTVPDGESAVQIKNRVKAKVQNPYNAGALKAKIRKEARETAKTEAMWEAQPQVFESIVGEGSAVASITARVPPKVAPMDPHLVSHRLLSYPVAPAPT